VTRVCGTVAGTGKLSSGVSHIEANGQVHRILAVKRNFLNSLEETSPHPCGGKCNYIARGIHQTGRLQISTRLSLAEKTAPLHVLSDCDKKSRACRGTRQGGGRKIRPYAGVKGAGFSAPDREKTVLKSAPSRGKKRHETGQLPVRKKTKGRKNKFRRRLNHSVNGHPSGKESRFPEPDIARCQELEGGGNSAEMVSGQKS